MIAATVLLPVLAGASVWAAGARVVPRHRARALGGAAVAALGVVLVAVLVAAVQGVDQRIVWGGTLELLLSADAVAGVVAVLVPAVALPVVAYAAVHEDAGELPRLLGLLIAFVGAMELLVLAADLLTLAIAWELVAALSWALIGSSWHRRDAVVQAGHAFNATRAGSVGLIVAAGAAFAGTGSFAYDAIAELPRPLVDAVAGGVLLAAASKSAQLPFSPWLFSAMAGPTPVSALLHSATMVAAGAYALVRLGASLAAAPWFGPAVIAVGVTTALVGGVVALAEVHGKRILAASTAAQYGLQFVAVGAGAAGAAAAHLVAHALFKALLFLAVGVGIATTGTADVTRWRLGRRLPRVAIAAAVGALALAAVPPLGGAWTKEQVVAAAVHAGPAVGALTLVAGLLSAAYAGRLHLLAFGRTGDAAVAAGPRARPSRVEVTAVAALAAGTVLLGVVWLPGARERVAALLGAAVEQGAPWETAVSVALVAVGLAWAWRAVAHDGSHMPAMVVRAASGWFGITTAADHLVVRPALAAAALAARFDDAVVDAPARAAGAAGAAVSRTLRRFDDGVVDGAVRSVARAARAASRAVAWTVELGVDGAVAAVAQATTWLGERSRAGDDRVVDGAVERVADAVGTAGTQSRRLQTGLAHHYYAIAAAGLVVLVAAAALWR